MLFPAQAFRFAQGLREIAGAVAEQQFLQALVGKRGARRGQLGRRVAAQGFEQAAVVVADETVVQILIHVQRDVRARALEHFGPDGIHVRRRGGQLGVDFRRIHVDAPLRGHGRRQGL